MARRFAGIFAALSATSVIPVGNALKRFLDPMHPSLAAGLHRLRHGLHLQRVHPRHAAHALLVEFHRPPLVNGGLAGLQKLVALRVQGLSDLFQVQIRTIGHGRPPFVEGNRSFRGSPLGQQSAMLSR